MSLVSDLGHLYKDLLKGNFRFGRRISGEITRNMDGGRGRAVGGAIDAVGGIAATGFFGASAVYNALAIVGAIVGVATASVTIPAAIGTVIVGTVIVGLGVLGVSAGLGLLSAFKDKAGISMPKNLKESRQKAAASYATGVSAVKRARPAEWSVSRLRAPFDKARAARAEKAAAKAAPPQPAPKAEGPAL